MPDNRGKQSAVPRQSEPISEQVLREHQRTGQIDHAMLCASPEGFILVTRIGRCDRVLHTRRGNCRFFRDVTRACRYLREMGLARVTVDLAGWQPA